MICFKFSAYTNYITHITILLVEMEMSSHGFNEQTH